MWSNSKKMKMMKSKKKSMKIPKIVDFIQYYNISLLLASGHQMQLQSFSGPTRATTYP